MKTTVELADDLYRRAKAEAALRGRKLKDIIQEGLQLVLDSLPLDAETAQSGQADEEGARDRASLTLPRIRSISRTSVAMAAIVDTGPLVAYSVRSDRHHRWATDRINELEAPLLVCEPVLTEAAYLLRLN